MSLKKLLKNRRHSGASVIIEEPSRLGKHKKGGQRYSNKLSYDELINAESAIGKTIFGPIPMGHQREFFEYRKNVWIWHESFVDPYGAMQEMTVRYEVRPNGVYKRPGNGNYRKIEGEELNNFRNAAKIYLSLVKAKLYS